MVEALDKAGLPFQAERVRGCGKFFTRWRCDECGEYSWTLCEPCQFRLCPWCAAARSAKAFAVYHDVLAAVSEPKMLVLTVRNIEMGRLEACLKRFAKCLRLLWERFLKRRIRGAVVSIEVTYNAVAKTWHPHAHLLLDGPYLEQALVAKIWSKLTEGWGQVVWIEKCEAGWERELLKYVTKQVAFLSQPEALREFVRATKRFRFLRTWGSFYNAGRGVDRCEDDWERLCPACGAVMVLDVKRQTIERFLSEGLHGLASAYPQGEPCPVADSIVQSDLEVPF